MTKTFQELDTDGWLFKVGDVYSSPYHSTHFKITKIELEDGAEIDDAFIFGYRVDPRDHSVRMEDSEEFEVDEYNRVWYLNDYWALDSDD